MCEKRRGYTHLVAEQEAYYMSSPSANVPMRVLSNDTALSWKSLIIMLSVSILVVISYFSHDKD